MRVDELGQQQFLVLVEITRRQCRIATGAKTPNDDPVGVQAVRVALFRNGFPQKADAGPDILYSPVLCLQGGGKAGSVIIRQWKPSEAVSRCKSHIAFFCEPPAGFYHSGIPVGSKRQAIDKTGKEKKKEVDVDVVGLDGISEYARFFDASSPYYEKNSEYNLTFLRAQQQYANDLLCAKGCLFLNDVYKMLGIQETKAGQVVGWVYDQNNTMGDNYVDFGLYDVNREKTRDFINGYEKVILLDFNVDGNIWDLM